MHSAVTATEDPDQESARIAKIAMNALLIPGAVIVAAENSGNAVRKAAAHGRAQQILQVSHDGIGSQPILSRQLQNDELEIKEEALMAT